MIKSAFHVATGDEVSVWRAETERGPVCLKVLAPTETRLTWARDRGWSN